MGGLFHGDGEFFKADPLLSGKGARHSLEELRENRTGISSRAQQSGVGKQGTHLRQISVIGMAYSLGSAFQS